MKRLLPYLALFFSFGTLICCAIPALLVALGFGAVLAASISAFPQIVWLSEHKVLVFGVAGVFLIAAVAARHSTRKITCQADAQLAAACQSNRHISGWLLAVAFVLYFASVFFAFVAPVLF